ncbi:putative RNA processing protein Grc3 [Aspergillus homomorphus CBS 101889]|uniref:Polynucleotide 5'-hydroxyl-kinase GRC3 n=1 Tax=Aspergillus homomorphus (strain CBS 101889) TaxID=1450537 RepID=A0A395HS74_ASPHC|nr:hypothetical protein BO97DRAFT_479367 [Aspergillus homomorphus CBS 101889]RAL10339.1 hypothetical protein BO97DRAFT_479367 [Aspergillus homomorphus CBS 101889]
MKRKAEKSQAAAPLSAVAARKARQQQAQSAAAAVEKPVAAESAGEPPSKKARRSPEEAIAVEQEENQPTRSTRRKDADSVKEPVQDARRVTRSQKSSQQYTPDTNQGGEDQTSSEPESEEEENAVVEANGVELASLQRDADEFESPADTPVQLQEFPLSKTRLNKNNIMYSDEHRLCVRIKEKMSLVLIGHYDLWVKRGVVSLMGAKLHPSSRVYRVYAPSTHSLPVIKCVSGVDGAAEIEVMSCHSGIYRLRHLSPLYERVWNGKNTAADKLTLKSASPSTKRTFSVLYTSADDSLKRHLRPLHLEKQWSSAIKSLSQRGGRLRTLICGPKASGKSTFSRYLLNHLLSPAPQTESSYRNTDGVAFLDLDPGQPEFSPMGQVYLAHLRSPVFGPPFSHPSLDDSRSGTIVRAHHIGASSPKEDPDHYVLAAKDLMDRYRSLLASYPQCSLIINYPGWIFGLGLEVATYLVSSLGLSDVVYMSEKGPAEVIEPLGQAAAQAKVPLTILPSQPTDFVSRSSAQLRSMQMQSYFHMTHPSDIDHPIWLEQPLSRTQPMQIHYSGPNKNIEGIMVMGSRIDADLLSEVIDGSIVAVVAVESPNALLGDNSTTTEFTTTTTTTTTTTDTASDTSMADDDDDDGDDDDDDDTEANVPPPLTTKSTTLTTNITLTPHESLPYLFSGAGSSNPLDPRKSHSLGLALVREINPSTQTLDLVTPIPAARIQEAREQGHALVLVRGQLDNPNWAISEEYYAARAAVRQHQISLAKRGSSSNSDAKLNAQEKRVAALLKDRVRRASTNVPWMTVIEDPRNRQAGGSSLPRERGLWRLRKKAYSGSGSEGEGEW